MIKTPAFNWTIALIYTGLIYTLAWYVTPLWMGLTDVMGTENAGQFVDKIVPVLGLVFVALLIFIVRIKRPSVLIWLAAIIAGYAYLLTLHAEYPVERIHLVQYSLVAWLYYRAVSMHTNRKSLAYIGAALAVLIIGASDEWIQENFIQNRSGTMEDVSLNWISGGLGLLGLLVIQQEGLIAWSQRLPRFLRYSVQFILPITAAGIGTQQVYTRFINPPLNLIIITVDCARSDRMGFNGYLRETSVFENGIPTGETILTSPTPYMDAMALNGAVFTNAYSQAAWTGPGVISTLSGLYPPTHGVTAQGKTMPKSVYTLLDAFKERGYRVPNMSYLTVDSNFKNIADMEDTGIDVTTTDEIGAINQWITSNHRKPFAFWYHWRFTHLPFSPPEKHRVYPPASDPHAVVPERIKRLINEEVIIPYTGDMEWTEEERAWINALYDGGIREWDHAFESIRYRLSLHHKLKNTIIVITADHGEELVDHGHVGHASTAVHSRHYDEHIHIPLLILSPKKIKKGRIIDTMVEQIDILPTVFDMMDWEIPESKQGRSLWSAIQGDTLEDQPVFAESVEGGYQSKLHQRTTFVRSVRTRDWKLITRLSPQEEFFELYNMIEDPKETINQFDMEPEIAEELLDELSRWITRNADDRFVLEEKEALLIARVAAMDPANLEVPTVVIPEEGDTIYYETNRGAIEAEWTGNPHAAYIIEYDIGVGWHRLKGEYPVEIGTKQIFGPLPRDGWKPLYQWNPYRLRIRPRDLPGGWSDWLTITVAPLNASKQD